MSATVAPNNPVRDLPSRSKPGYEQEVRGAEEPQVRTKFILTSTDLDKIESVSASVLERARMAKCIAPKGPTRLPTKTLKITTRKSPCGEGSKTYDAYEMRIHKRCINLRATKANVKYIVSHAAEHGVKIEVTCQNLSR